MVSDFPRIGLDRFPIFKGLVMTGFYVIFLYLLLLLELRFIPTYHGIYSEMIFFRFQSLNLTHVPDHSIPVYQFR